MFLGAPECVPISCSLLHHQSVVRACCSMMQERVKITAQFRAKEVKQTSFCNVYSWCEECEVTIITLQMATLNRLGRSFSRNRRSIEQLLRPRTLSTARLPTCLQSSSTSAVASIHLQRKQPVAMFSTDAKRKT